MAENFKRYTEEDIDKWKQDMAALQNKINEAELQKKKDAEAKEELKKEAASKKVQETSRKEDAEALDKVLGDYARIRKEVSEKIANANKNHVANLDTIDKEYNQKYTAETQRYCEEIQDYKKTEEQYKAKAIEALKKFNCKYPDGYKITLKNGGVSAIQVIIDNMFNDVFKDFNSIFNFPLFTTIKRIK